MSFSGKKEYEYKGKFKYGVARIKENGKWGLINSNGEQVLPPEFEEIVTLSFNNGLMGVKIDGKWGLADHNGDEIVPAIYDDIFPYYGRFGISKVKKNNSWGLINKEGKVITSIEYDKIESFGRGLALKRSDGHWDFIQTSGSKKDIVTSLKKINN